MMLPIQRTVFVHVRILYTSIFIEPYNEQLTSRKVDKKNIHKKTPIIF